MIRTYLFVYQGARNVNFSKGFACVLNEWPLFIIDYSQAAGNSPINTPFSMVVALDEYCSLYFVVCKHLNTSLSLSRARWLPKCSFDDWDNITTFLHFTYLNNLTRKVKGIFQVKTRWLRDLFQILLLIFNSLSVSLFTG